MKTHYIQTWTVRRAIKFCSERFVAQRLHDEKFVHNAFEFAKSDETPRKTRREDVNKFDIVR